MFQDGLSVAAAELSGPAVSRPKAATLGRMQIAMLQHEYLYQTWHRRARRSNMEQPAKEEQPWSSAGHLRNNGIAIPVEQKIQLRI